MGLLNTMADQGRGGDTRIAHVTPGEMVLPREVAAVRPDIVAHIVDTIRQMGGNPAQTVVGKGRINPNTGVEEFATQEEINAAFQQYLGRAAGAGALGHWGGANITADQMRAAVSGSAEARERTGLIGAGIPAAQLGNFSDLHKQGFMAADAAAGNAANTTTTAPRVYTANDVNSIFQTTFGRPAAQEGIDYWTNVANTNPGLDLATAIRSAASKQDVNAMNDITADSLDTTTTWGNDLLASGVNNSQVTYDPVANKWVGTPSTQPIKTTVNATGDTGGNVTVAQTDNILLPETRETTAVPAAVTPPAEVVNAAVTPPAEVVNAAVTPPAEVVNAAVTPPAEVVNAVQDPTKGTVQGQLGGIINANSPLMQRAAQRGLDMANSRGLLNSGMAIGSAQNAIMDYALPIAQTDAGFSNQFALTNAGEANTTNRFNTANQQQTNLFNAGEGNTTNRFNTANQQQTNLFNAGEANTTNRFNTANQQQTNLFNAGEANTTNRFNTANTQQSNLFNAEAQNQANTFNAQQSNAMATEQARLSGDLAKFNAAQQNQIASLQLDHANRIELANIQATYQNQMQANASSSALFTQTMAALNNIQQSTTMDADAKRAAIDQQVEMLKAGLSLNGAVANLNLSEVLDFSV